MSLITLKFPFLSIFASVPLGTLKILLQLCLLANLRKELEKMILHFFILIIK